MLNLIMERAPDLQGALDALDVTLPSEAEIDAIMRKRLTKGALVLTTLGQDEPIQEGDAVIFAVTGGTGKYNKPKLMVTVGQGLYNKDIEAGMVGHRTGDSYDDQAEDVAVRITILEIRRKTVPEPTDEMAAAMGIEGVTNLGEYRVHLTNELTDHVVHPATAQVVEKLVEQAAPQKPDESVIRTLGELEWDFFCTIYKNEKGIDLEQLTSEELMEHFHCESKQAFLDMRRDWYITKARQCVVLGTALGVELTGELDALTQYEALSKLTMLLVDRVRAEIKGRNA